MGFALSSLAIAFSCFFCVLCFLLFFLRERIKFKFLLYKRRGDGSVLKKSFKKGYSSNSEEWKKSVFEIGRVYKSHQVDAVYFVHGTFVGEDPLDVFYFFNESIQKVFKKFFNQAKKHFVKDNGIFSDEYIELFQGSIGSDIESHHFTWSSGNHHFARLSGAFDLLKHAVDTNERSGARRFLMIGHSHAGQIFALLSQMISDVDRGECFAEKICQGGYLGSKNEMITLLNKAKLFRFDFITLGTPVRYDFYLTSKMSLLHLINHRENERDMDLYVDVLKTQCGDYIQQWGSSGTDLRSPIQKVEKVNQDLDLLLDVGRDLNIWRENLKKQRSLPKQGVTLLVDYQDNGTFMNCVATLFGHGVYTRVETMSFLLENIALFLDHRLSSDALEDDTRG